MMLKSGWNLKLKWRDALGQALKVILDTFALGKWTINKTMRNFFNTMYRACVYTVDC